MKCRLPKRLKCTIVRYSPVPFYHIVWLINHLLSCGSFADLLDKDFTDSRIFPTNFVLYYNQNSLQQCNHQLDIMILKCNLNRWSCVFFVVFFGKDIFKNWAKFETPFWGRFTLPTDSPQKSLKWLSYVLCLWVYVSRSRLVLSRHVRSIVWSTFCSA